MNFEEIQINHKEIFDKYIEKSNLKASEYNFTNFFMWRKFYKAKFMIEEDLLCVLAEPEFSKPFMFMPMGEISDQKLKSVVDKMYEFFKKNGWQLCFSRVEEDSLKYFKSLTHFDFIYDYDRNNCDYLYNTDELINLSGKKFNKKRNHLNSFLKEYTYSYDILNDTYLDECKNILQAWCDRRECKCYRGEYCERYASTEILDNYNLLDIRGAIFEVNDKYEAFTIGENYIDNYAVIHVEKANDSIRGLYNLVNRDFVANEFKNTEYINREQDLGEHGLRKAKLSYQPIRFVEKYNIYL